MMQIIGGLTGESGKVVRAGACACCRLPPDPGAGGRVRMLVSVFLRRGVIGSPRLCCIGAPDAARGGVMPKTTRE